MMPAKVKDYTGRRFGKLVVVEFAGIRALGTKGHSGAQWRCRCDCGNAVVIRRKYLAEGNSASCGCGRAEGLIRHGHAKAKGKHSRTYKIWTGMRARCSNPRLKSYKSYGGKGVHVCDQWNSFETFLADMGECPKGYSIERINPAGNYEPENCKWIPLQEQHNNKQKLNFCVLEGERMRLRQADKKLGRTLGYLSNWYVRGKEPPHIPNLKFEW